MSAAGVSISEWNTVLSAEAQPSPALRIGLVTDVHYADKPAGRTRYYRDSLAKLSADVDRFNRDPLDAAVMLGDFIDSGETAEEEIEFLKKIQSVFAGFKGPRHYVLGNHDSWSLTKTQFLRQCGAVKEFYSFNHGRFHFVILDACYRADGVSYGNKNFDWKDSEIPPDQREWLGYDLDSAEGPTIVFVHQRLDVANEYAVKSAPAVRKILEDSKKVVAVFQGHSHKNDYHEIGGIHYCTLRAVVEGPGAANNACAELSVFPDGSLKVAGFDRQQSYQWPAPAR